MKKMILVVVLATVCLFANAQDGLKGTWFAGGELSYGSSHIEEGKQTTTTVLPIVGTFISPDVAIGVGVGYMGSKLKDDGVQIEKTNGFVIKPLVRKYWNISGGLFFFGQAALPVIIGNTTLGDGDASVKVNSTQMAIQLAPGFDYVVNSWLTIEASFPIFSAGFNTAKPKGGDSTTDFHVNANPFNSVDDRTLGSLQLGVKFLF